MLLPALNSAREKARRANCQGNLKQIGTALKSYSISENLLPIYGANGTTNGTSALALLIQAGELTDFKVFVCPSSTTAAGSAPTDLKVIEGATGVAAALIGHVSYAYIPGIDSAAGSGSGIAADGWKAEGTYNHTEFGNIMFGDGSVRASVGTANKYWINDANWLKNFGPWTSWEGGNTNQNGPEIKD